MAILSTLLLMLSGSHHSMLWSLILRCTKSQDPRKGIVAMLWLSPFCKLSIVCTWFQSLVRWWMLPGVWIIFWKFVRLSLLTLMFIILIFCYSATLWLDEVLTRGVATASVMFNPSFMFNVYCKFFWIINIFFHRYLFTLILLSTNYELIK